MLVRLVPAIGAIVLCAGALAAAPGGTAGVVPDSERLPDLDQAGTFRSRRILGALDVESRVDEAFSTLSYDLDTLGC